MGGDYSTEKKVIGVIGAGPSGLAVINAFHNEILRLSHTEEHGDKSFAEIAALLPFKLLVFERQSKAGGRFNAMSRTEVDEYGLPAAGPMYRHFFSCLPKESLEFGDYSFDEHFGGKDIGSFPPREVLLHYFMGRMTYHGQNILDLETFEMLYQHNVTDIQPVETIGHDFVIPGDEAKGMESLSSQDVDTGIVVHFHDLKEDKMGSAYCDFLVSAAGATWSFDPHKIKGIDAFNGRLLNPEQFRGGKEFHGQKVLVIGPDSDDSLAAECWKFGAKNVYVSRYVKGDNSDAEKAAYPADGAVKVQPNWPEGMTFMPPLQELVDGMDALFTDGQTVKGIDVIIANQMAHRTFPFIKNKKVKLNPDLDWLCPKGLYKGVIDLKYPRLLYVGLQNLWYSTLLQDVQAMFIKEFISGRYDLPPKDEVESEMKAWEDKLKECVDESTEIRFQSDYIIDLNNQLEDTKEYISNSELLDRSKMIEQYRKDCREDIVTYRDKVYQSVFSKKDSVQFHQTPWAQCFDDSLKFYVGDLSHTKPQIVVNGEDGGEDKEEKEEMKTDDVAKEADMGEEKEEDAVLVASPNSQ